jgi:hypothetical protein
VWFDNTPGNFEIFFARSTDGGATFGTPINLSNNPGTGGLDFPRVAAYGKNVYVVWRDNTAIASGNNEVFFSRSTDNGATFASPINLSKTSAGSDPAEIAAISDNVYVLWREGISSSTIPDILFAGSTNNGTSFNTINISKTSGDSSMPSMAISGTRNVSVVWEDNTNSIAGSYYPYFSRSTDSGSTFSKPIVVANITGEAREPRVAMSDDKVHIVWSEDEQEIYYTTNTISDNPPNCITALPTRSVLWPPNHLMNNVMITGITDPDGDPIKVKITSIHQDEPTKTNPGDPSPDGAGIGTNTAQIRAERTMPGDGRVYHIAFTADDGRGKTCDGEVTVSVPPDQAHSAIDSAPPSYDSTR